MVEKQAAEQTIFEAARQLDSPAERDECLSRMCDGDSGLRGRVEALLRAYDQSPTFLETPPKGVAADQPLADQPLAEQPGTIIGPYKLLQQIGEGGMGVVYMAEQSEPVARRVALKIIKPGMDSRQVIARFEAERQALAVMDHPNVSKVIDAGTAKNGRSYFVMELVKGISITQYCDEQKLSVRERLELFVPVCQAIQHAHQKGIIHRDIKPSNVMVAQYDDRAVPKIIDFGVAKATEQRLTEKTVFTQFGQIVGTFEYMSPEQAKLNQLDIDTRSDVYSLGVLLYELLTGETPFNGERLRSAAFDELLRIIREEDPPRPSLRLSTSGTLPESAANRQVQPKRLSSLVRGELDWIVMKALEKDRTRRYETATALGADIENYLNDEPVEACPPSSVYMIGKFTRRNKGWLSTVAAVLMTVFAGLTVSTILFAKERDAAEQSAQLAEESAKREAIAAAEADRQRKRAEDNLRESRAAVDRLFTRAAKELANVPHMSQLRRTLLEDAAEFYEGFFQQKSDDPEIRFEMGRAYQRLGSAYEQLGRHDEAVVVTNRAAKTYEQLAAHYPAKPVYRIKLADSLHELAVRQKRSGRNEHSVATMRRSLEITEQLVREHPTVMRYRCKAARLPVGIANQMSDTPGAEQERIELCRESLARWEQFRRDFPNLEILRWQEGHSHHWLASSLMKIGQFEEAEEHLRLSRDIRTRLLQQVPQHPGRRYHLAHVEIYLANTLLHHGALVEAEQTVLSAAKVLQDLVDDFPGVDIYRHQLSHAYSVHAKVLTTQRRFEEAEQALLRNIAVRGAPGDPTAANIYESAWPYYQLGLLYSHQDKNQQAADAFRSAFGFFEQAFSAADAEAGQQRQVKKAMYWTLVTCPLPQFRDAERAIEYSKEFLQQEPESADGWNALGIGHYRAGHWDEAIEALGKSVELRDGGNSSDCYFLAMVHGRRGDQGQAQQWYQSGVSKEEDAGKALELDLLNFRREAEKLLGISDEEPIDGESNDTKSANVESPETESTNNDAGEAPLDSNE